MKQEVFDKAMDIQSEIHDINTQLSRLEFAEKSDWSAVQVSVGNCSLYITRRAYEDVFADIKKKLLARHTVLVAEFQSL